MPIDLRTARKRAKLSQQALANFSGVDKATISRLERRSITNPLSDTVTKLETTLTQYRGLKRGDRLTFAAADSDRRARRDQVSA